VRRANQSRRSLWYALHLTAWSVRGRRQTPTQALKDSLRIIFFLNVTDPTKSAQCI
jgi:hypothetical protein